jgi:hypothetical protein
VPAWPEGKSIEIRHENPNPPEHALTPQHEVLEAFRWMRDLLASGEAIADVQVAVESEGRDSEPAGCWLLPRLHKVFSRWSITPGSHALIPSTSAEK